MFKKHYTYHRYLSSYSILFLISVSKTIFSLIKYDSLSLVDTYFQISGLLLCNLRETLWERLRFLPVVTIMMQVKKSATSATNVLNEMFIFLSKRKRPRWVSKKTICCRITNLWKTQKKLLKRRLVLGFNLNHVNIQIDYPSQTLDWL